MKFLSAEELFKIAKIIKVEKHPNADRLKICDVNIGNKDVNYIADRNPLKYNLFTPGTKIKIISEDYSRRLRPDYYLVLPWHFKKEILIREKKIRKKGTKFIFPLPNMKVV